MSDEDLETMLSYLREHSARYRLGALRGQLVAAGYSPEAVDRAIAQFRAESPPPERPAWRLALLVAAVDLALLVAVFATTSIPEDPEVLLDITFFGLSAFYFAQAVAGLMMLSLPAKSRLGGAFLFGLILFVGVAILAAGGICLAILASVF